MHAGRKKRKRVTLSLLSPRDFFHPFPKQRACSQANARAFMDARWLSGHHTRLSLRKYPFLLALRRWGRSFPRNVPSGEERGETDVFAGYPTTSRLIFPGVISAVHSLVAQSAFRLEYLHFLLLKFDFFKLCGEEYSWLEAGAHGLLLEVMNFKLRSGPMLAVLIHSL